MWFNRINRDNCFIFIDYLVYLERSSTTRGSHRNKAAISLGVMKNKLKTAQDEASQLSHKITEMEKDLNQIENSPKILKKIKEQLLIKGFISDKEITDIEKDFFG